MTVLPDIRINATPDPHAFLRELERLALAHGGYDADLRGDIDSTDFEILNLRPAEPVPFDGLGVQLLVSSRRGPWADVEVRAPDWGGEPVPDRATYVGAARAVLSPLLLGYNRAHGTRRCLLVEREHAVPPLPRVAADLFATFVGCANKSALHPNDWDRFYDFVRHCAARNVSTSSEDVQRLLIHAGFAHAVAERVAAVFFHGRRLLTYCR